MQGKRHKHHRFIGGLIAALVAAGPGDATAGEPSWSGNLLPNPSFEDGDAGWIKRLGAHFPDAAERVESILELDDSVAHSGAKSVRMVADSKTTFWWGVDATAIPAKENQRYRISGWIKTNDVRKEGEQFVNCNVYAQFRDAEGKIVLDHDSPVRATQVVAGTEDWIEVERIIRTPPGTVEIVVGITLTCSGEAWFDDIGLYAALPIDWVELETARFIYHYEKGADPPPQENLALNDNFIADLEKAVGVKHEGRIQYYRYASAARKAEVTGSTAQSHYEGNEIHAISWSDRHDLVHVIFDKVGSPGIFLGEGAAVYFADILGGDDPHREVRGLIQGGATFPLAKLIDPRTFPRVTARTTEPLIGSFVGSLIEEHGIEMFKELYRKTDGRMTPEEQREVFKVVYGAELGDLRERWIERVQTVHVPGH